jgi:hypothetical protein
LKQRWRFSHYFLDLPDRFRRLETIITPGRPISHILRAWPSDVPLVPLSTWVRPRVGILQLEERHWLFNIHDSIEVQFVGLPAELKEAVVEALRAGTMDAIQDLPGCGPIVEATYFGMGRNQGVTTWTVHESAQSTGFKAGNLSISDHKNSLDELVRDGFLIAWPGPTPEDPYFVMALESRET